MRKGYQKLTNLLNKTNDQQPKFRTREWLEISDDVRGTYKAGK